MKFASSAYVASAGSYQIRSFPSHRRPPWQQPPGGALPPARAAWPRAAARRPGSWARACGPRPGTPPPGPAWAQRAPARRAGAPLARYAAWRRAGDFIFLSGIIPVNPLTGTIVNGFQDVPELVRELLGAAGEFSTDAKQGPILAQSWYVLESIRRTVESAGGQMSDVIKLVQYFRNLDHFPYYSRVRKLFYPDQPPVSTVVQVSEMLPDATVLIEVEATVWLPQPIHSEAPR